MTCGFLRLVFAIGAVGGKTKPPEERPHGKPIDRAKNGIGGYAADGNSQYSGSVAPQRERQGVVLLRTYQQRATSRGVPQKHTAQACLPGAEGRGDRQSAAERRN